MIRRDTPPEEEVALAVALAPFVEEVWIVEDLSFAGGIAQIGAVLEATGAAGHSVSVCHGIAPAPFRNPAALAMEWAALERMYPGRLRCGLGHGLQSWMSEIGERVDSPLGLFHETLESVRSIMSGAPTTVDGTYVQLDGVQLTFPPAVPPGVLAGVTGPKSLELSGEIADGTVLPEGFGPAEIEQALAHINRGRERAGRTDHHDITVFVGFHCGDLSELGAPPEGLEPIEFDVVGPDVTSVLPGLRALVAAGADGLCILPYGPDPVGQLKLVREEIWPRLG